MLSSLFSPVFQSTPLREGRLEQLEKRFDFEDISIHAPTRGATFSIRSSCSYRSQISIHAPTRGATALDNAPDGRLDISIHAPTRGATIHFGGSDDTSTNFNPRPYERGDPIGNIFLYHRVISIHAPTRGATVHVPQRFHKEGISIHAPTRGATLQDITITGLQEISIHAPTRGATLQYFPKSRPLNNFNPRPYERGDREILIAPVTADISIHAPTRGATSL